MIQRDIHPDTYLQSMIQTLIDKNQKLCGKMHQLQVHFVLFMHRN
jgi:hypothetical protein